MSPFMLHDRNAEVYLQFTVLAYWLPNKRKIKFTQATEVFYFYFSFKEAFKTRNLTNYFPFLPRQNQMPQNIIKISSCTRSTEIPRVYLIQYLISRSASLCGQLPIPCNSILQIILVLRYLQLMQVLLAIGIGTRFPQIANCIVFPRGGIFKFSVLLNRVEEQKVS